MTKIAVIGSSGMLGSYVSKYFESVGVEVLNFNRDNFDILKQDSLSLFKLVSNLKDEEVSVIVNCAGLINTRMYEFETDEILQINSIFPKKLSRECDELGVRMVHITTDCVFAGKRGKYIEFDEHDALDLYGRTKSLGEPKDCIGIRTSIIGESKNGRSLVEWVKKNKDNKINGYLSHFWNGITCLELAKCIEKMINNNLWWRGVSHIHSPKDYSKYDLLKLINDIYELNIEIDPIVSTCKNMTLRSSLYPCRQLMISELPEQIKEMKEFNILQR